MSSLTPSPVGQRLGARHKLAHGACSPAIGRALAHPPVRLRLTERVPRPALKAASQDPIEALRYE